MRKSRVIHWGVRVSLSVAAFFCATAAHGRDLGRISPYGSFVAAADLDGDHRSDVATAGASRRDAAGYAFDISFRLSSVSTDAITVRTARIASRLLLRDLDGDSDRDLVVESFDREPLAVLLNDGDGHFRQGNLADFGALLRRSDSSFEAPPIPSDSPDPGEPLDAPAAGLVTPGGEPDVVAAHA